MFDGRFFIFGSFVIEIERTAFFRLNGSTQSTGRIHEIRRNIICVFINCYFWYCCSAEAHALTRLSPVSSRLFRGTLHRTFIHAKCTRPPQTFNEFSLHCFCVNIDARVRRNANAPSTSIRNRKKKTKTSHGEYFVRHSNRFIARFDLDVAGSLFKNRKEKEMRAFATISNENQWKICVSFDLLTLHPNHNRIRQPNTDDSVAEWPLECVTSMHPDAHIKAMRARHVERVNNNKRNAPRITSCVEYTWRPKIPFHVFRASVRWFSQWPTWSIRTRQVPVFTSIGENICNYCRISIAGLAIRPLD